MAADPLPAEVKQFIVIHLASVEELEILLKLAKGEKLDWTVDEVYQVIMSSRGSVERALEKFLGSGFLQKAAGQIPTYSFRPQSGDSVIKELGRCYQVAPVSVIEAIYQKNRDSVQGFADAFKIKRDDS